LESEICTPLIYTAKSVAESIKKGEISRLLTIH